MTDKLLTTKEAADVLSVSPSTMERWRTQGVGPGFEKCGPRVVRYRLGVLLSWLRRFRSTSEY